MGKLFLHKCRYFKDFEVKKGFFGKIFKAPFLNQSKIVLLSIPFADTFEKKFSTFIRGRGTFFQRPIKIAFL
jgi:hypothetical protein